MNSMLVKLSTLQQGIALFPYISVWCRFISMLMFRIYLWFPVDCYANQSQFWLVQRADFPIE
jgi:hypothetical protein